jgi:uncharacterized protein
MKGDSATGFGIYGWLRYSGQGGLKKDEDDALKYLVRGAELGESSAQYWIGMGYLKGDGVPVDLKAGYKWVKAAAEQRHKDAIHNMGWIYLNGIGRPKDLAKAHNYHLKACELGDTQSMNIVGASYETGRGIGKNYEEAIYWYKKAAGLGNAKAAKNLRRLKLKKEFSKALRLAVGFFVATSPDGQRGYYEKDSNGLSQADRGWIARQGR